MWDNELTPQEQLILCLGLGLFLVFAIAKIYQFINGGTV